MRLPFFSAQSRTPSRRQTLRVEQLESRLAPAYWITEGGGEWTDPANWSGNDVPGPGEDAIIDNPYLPAGSVVTIQGNAECGRISSRANIVVVGDKGGSLSITGGGDPSQILGDLQLTPNADLTVRNMSLVVTGSMTSEGSTSLSQSAYVSVNGSVTEAGEVTIGEDASFAAAGGGTVSGTVTTTAATTGYYDGEYILSGGSFTVSGTFAGTGWLVSSGAAVTMGANAVPKFR